MKFSTNYVIHSLTTKKGYLALFAILYVIYVRLNALFAEYIGLSLDVAETGSIVEFNQYMIQIIVVTLSTVFLSFSYKLFESIYMKHVYSNLKNRVFGQLMKKSIVEYENLGSTSISSLFLNDIPMIEKNYIKPCMVFAKESINLIIHFVIMIQINWIATLFVLVVSFVPILLPNLFMKKLQDKIQSYSEDVSSFTVRSNELLFGMEQFKNFNVEDKVIERFIISNKKAGNSKKIAFTYLDKLTNSIAISSIMITIGVLVVGMFLAIFNILTIGEVFAISFISNGISGPLNNICDNVPKLIGAKPLLDKYNKYFDEDFSSKKKLEDSIKSGFKIKNVIVQKSERNILDDVDLTIDLGKKYAFIGESGSGKSTALKLLLGFYSDYRGSVQINKSELKEMELDSLYKHITYIHQNSVMFEASIRDNISLFDGNISEEWIIELLEIVELADRIKNTEEGIEAIIREGGMNFSGGEKQRISIARALAHNKDIIIMDEATSALDYSNFLKVEQYLVNMKNKTLITVTHRLVKEILKQYDRLYIFKEGKIVEDGSFDELIIKDGYFKKLYDNQVISKVS